MEVTIRIETSKEAIFFDYVDEISDKINEALGQKDYGGGLSLGFLFVVRSFSPVRNAGDFFKPVEIYRPKKKEVVISYTIPFEEVSKENNNEKVLNLTAQGLLESIQKFKKLGVKNFDIDAFYSDVQKICKDNNWI